VGEDADVAAELLNVCTAEGMVVVVCYVVLPHATLLL
jgi:hypothetical protein